MKRKIITLSIVFLFLFCFQSSHALKLTGSWHRSTNWAFLTSFCFSKTDTGYGNLTWTFNSDQTFVLSIYNDSSNSWNKAYKSDAHCDALVEDSQKNEQTKPGKPGSYLFKDLDTYKMYYFALSDCLNDELELQKMDVHIWNGFNSQLSQEFSCEDQGMLGLVVFYFIAFFILTCIQSFIVFKLLKGNNFQPISRLYYFVLIFRTLGIFFVMIHFGSYAQNGKGSISLEVFGEILSTISTITFMTIIILVAKGWSISVQYIIGKSLILVLMGVFLVISVILIIAAYIVLDKGQHYYIFEEVPGVLYQIVRLVIMSIFLYYLRKTYLLEQDSVKRKFYQKFGILFTIWFLYLPLISLFSLGISGVYRKKVTQAFYYTFDFLILAGMSWFLWPSVSKKYFTYDTANLLTSENTGFKSNTEWDAFDDEAEEENSESSSSQTTSNSNKNESDVL
ncbi:intimal thickness receptor-related [Anaeramoeba flamelloides]|uniref:Intimal thickness receptor-related n=1 Tax=Anaeramoeba flamelloides TaxID=1746091 RepID=A0ABQ8X3W9_9EUKA|nr:intimal thickness receptor-related [Anaeramoeba flamelloides]